MPLLSPPTPGRHRLRRKLNARSPPDASASTPKPTLRDLLPIDQNLDRNHTSIATDRLTLVLLKTACLTESRVIGVQAVRRRPSSALGRWVSASANGFAQTP